nr:bifunctional nuclease 2-like [Ipomoea batatas]
MNSLQGPVVCPVVHAKRTGPYSVPVKPSALVKASKILRSEFWRLDGIHCRQAHFPLQQHSRISKLIACGFSSSSNGNGSRAENFNENDADYVNSSVVEAVEVRSSPDGFMIKMRDGRELRCVHNNPQSGHLPDYAPHAAIVLRMEDEIGLLLPIIVLEMSSMLLMEAICDVQIAQPTVYQVVKDMIEKMGYEVKLVRITKRVHEAYFARLYLTKQLDNECESISFDLRPSDAINIAVRCKVPIQVNKHLAFSDGMRITEYAKPLMQGSSDGLLLTGLDRPTGQPCIEAEEFILLRNMLIAAAEERYKDAGRNSFDKANCNHNCSRMKMNCVCIAEDMCNLAASVTTHEDDEVPQCNICIIILHKLFSNFSRRCLNLQQQLFNLLVQSMFLNPKVIRSQNFEATESAVGHLYVLVHATWAQQSGIEPILVIRRQHYDSLVSAARPQPIYQVQHSREINLFVGTALQSISSITRMERFEEPMSNRLKSALHSTSLRSRSSIISFFISGDIAIVLKLAGWLSTMEDVREVSPKHNVFVLVVKAQLEISLLCFRIAVAISFADLLNCCGFQFPHHLHLVVEIDDFLIPIDGDDQFLVFLRLDHFDSSRCFGDLSSQEEVSGLEHVV